MTQQKEQQKKLLSEIMEADQKNGLYEDSNKIVTAVEWLMQKIEKSLPNFMEVWREEFIQAKQMDKARIIDAFNRGEIQGLKSTNNSFHSSLITAEEYYNKTYGKE